ncbi:cupin domain-containing protein [Actinoplanes derwentensis]|uniref:Mannose-6-phosphate isomerase, cupin superfamily n=1 Tax=Actinoplanes derwentensis TaxID=113562 RepID=A0A1H2D995_9ACTN|nr:cupin domain-containing protein [Actinoplanes derwentensis]GID86411.1 cupin [Actinoplanes derwentensis]SDT79137.1 Mannose-6-phosphate isomerase, cupin superfamily [Actinoplanes derwentensis]
MSVYRGSEAVAHRMDGVVFHAYASPSNGSRELCAWRVEIASGVTGSPHRVGRDEVLMVLSGALSFRLDGVAGLAGPGDVVVVPAGSEFQAGNGGPVTASAWVTTSAGFEATMPDGTTITPPWAS